MTAVSERLGFNRSYLCRHFKLKTGKTISDYITELLGQHQQTLDRIQIEEVKIIFFLH
ncbi:MAG: helix-turn-helix transcriptional regulator [Mobilitalea sp.]